MNDLLHDEAVGFQVFTTDDIDDMGAEGIATALKKRLGKGPVYLSFDIDTIDPSMAPASKITALSLAYLRSWNSREWRLDDSRSEAYHPSSG